MFKKQLEDMIQAGLLAKVKVLEIYNEEFEVQIKSDDSPVTKADLLADKLITEYLKNIYPDYGFLTEESKDNKDRLNKDFVFIIDPVDGTADFVDKNDEFAINIALSYKHEIVAGVIFIPALNTYYYALKDNGSYKVDSEGKTERIHVSSKVEDLTCLTSRFHVASNELELIEKHSDLIKHVKTYGSSLKACLIAEGKAEITYRLKSGTKEWDTAPFEVIIKEAGGIVVKPNGTPMVYNREEVRNLEGYIVANKKENVLL